MRRLIHALLFKMCIWHTPVTAQDVEMFSNGFSGGSTWKAFGHHLCYTSNKGNLSDKISDGPAKQKFLSAS